MADDQRPTHTHNVTVVYHYACGDAVRSEQVSSPLDTGGTG